MILEAGKSQIKMPAHLVPGGSPLPGFQMDAFCCFFTGQKERWYLSSKPHLNLIISQRPLILLPTYCELGLQHIPLEGSQTFGP